MERRALVVPGCHDAMSAKVINDCWFEAIQVSGYGVAASLLAKPDAPSQDGPTRWERTLGNLTARTLL